MTVTDTLPAGLSPAAADSGTINGWNVSYSGQTVTATRNNALAAGASYPALTVTVNVAASAPTSVTNVATVSGGGEVNSSNDTASDPTTLLPGATIAGRYIFYNNSSFDGNDAAANAQDDAAIAPDKAPLLPGGTASFANYTSYSGGINGIIIDVANLAQVPAASDFTFQVGNGGDWTSAPPPSALVVRPSPGGASRIDITWPDGAIAKQWLKVVVPHNVVGLPVDDVFYWGNAIGDTGNSTADTYVNAIDEILTRHNSTTSAGILNVEDFNRDGKVDAGDVNIVRQNGTNFTSALRLITAPAAGSAKWIGGGSDANWSTAANWEGTTPAAGTSLDFTGSGNSTTNDLAAVEAGSITFSAESGPFALNGNAVSLRGDIADASPAAQSIGLPILLVAGDATLTSDTGTLEISGDISDGGAGYGIRKIGAGMVVLSGNNSYLRGTTVAGGTLIIMSAAAIPSGTSLTVGDDSAFNASSGPADSVHSAAPAMRVSSAAAAAVQLVAPPVAPASLTDSVFRSYQRSPAESTSRSVQSARASNPAHWSWVAAAKLLQSTVNQRKGDSLPDPNAVDAVLAEWM